MSVIIALGRVEADEDFRISLKRAAMRATALEYLLARSSPHIWGSEDQKDMESEPQAMLCKSIAPIHMSYLPQESLQISSTLSQEF